MNRTFKVVGKYLPEDEQESWCRGKPNTQAKKRTYTSEMDFDTYSPDLIKRWEAMYKVNVYELINNKWKDYYESR